MYRWCTDEVEPQDRFDYWRDIRAKGLFGVTAELERDHRDGFSGEFTLRRFGGAGLVELRASSYWVERGKADMGPRRALAAESAAHVRRLDPHLLRREPEER